MATLTLYPRTAQAGNCGFPGFFGSFEPILPLSRITIPIPDRGMDRDEEAADPDLDDARWIQRVEAGDEEAALTMIRRLYPTIIRSVRRHRTRWTSEEDLTQAIYLKVFKKIGQFSGRVPLEHWVSRIAINTCLNYLRHEVVRPELRMSDLSEEEEVVVQHLATSTEEYFPGDQHYAARELLERLMECLKPDQRLVVTLLHLEERSVAEISALTGWSESGVKLKAFRARRKMRKMGEALVGDEIFDF